MRVLAYHDLLLCGSSLISKKIIHIVPVNKMCAEDLQRILKSCFLPLTEIVTKCLLTDNVTVLHIAAKDITNSTLTECGIWYMMYFILVF